MQKLLCLKMYPVHFSCQTSGKWTHFSGLLQHPW
uniref:Uncharacterized protein n=1 Tax=Anguilla anguilla TaxID=7936 RepID=A0A0E9TDI1_ANGAN